MMRSHSCIAQFAYAVPCMPSIPSESGSVSGNAPLPMSVVVTGMRVLCARRRTSADAPDEITPPPT